MPKDTSTAVNEDMGATLSSTNIQHSTKKVTKASTLSAMWTKKSSTSTTVKASTAKKTAAVEAEEPQASSSSSVEKRELSQTTAVTQAILDNLEHDTMGDSWLEALKPEFKKPYFISLKKFLLGECTAHAVFPKIDDVYSWSRYTPLDQVKVVVLGQDPYHDEGQAHGLSFSVLPPTKPPGSLRNIYKQLEQDYPGFKPPKTGDLSPLAKQGVLWLNTSLTVRAHKPASHSKKGWETFTAQVLRTVLQRKGNDQPGVVFMAWGLPAQKTLGTLAINESKHLILKSAHPSPLSAHKGFLGNGHFLKANEWLANKYGKEAEIDWSVMSAK